MEDVPVFWRETGFDRRVYQIVNASCHQFATDVSLGCVPWRMSRRWVPQTRYI